MTPPAPGRAAPGAGICCATGIAEALLIAACVLGVLRILHTGPLGPASWIAIGVLPLTTAWVLARRGLYAVHHLLFAPFQPLALTGAWIEGFGLALVLAVLARSVEPVALRHLAMLIPELGAMFAAGLAGLLAARLGWAVLRLRYAARTVPTPRVRCLSPFHRAQKRALDVMVALLLLAITAPVMAAIALAIRLESPGPALFRQLRVGRGGALFEILKFRTMNIRPTPAGPSGDLQTIQGDCRVTRLGALLRRHSLDELPQLLNVLRGDMSIVGPRPHASAMTVQGMALEALVPDYPDRFMVRPGITGWAQINGRRGMIDTANALQSRVDHDLHYIEHWSVGLDLTILARTIRCIIRDDQAF